MRRAGSSELRLRPIDQLLVYNVWAQGFARSMLYSNMSGHGGIHGTEGVRYGVQSSGAGQVSCDGGHYLRLVRACCTIHWCSFPVA